MKIQDAIMMFFKYQENQGQECTFSCINLYLYMYGLVMNPMSRTNFSTSPSALYFMLLGGFLSWVRVRVRVGGVIYGVD